MFLCYCSCVIVLVLLCTQLTPFTDVTNVESRRISSRLASLPKKEYVQSQSDGDDVEPCVHNELVVKKETVGTRRMGCVLQAKHRVAPAVKIDINVTATEASGRHPVRLRVKTTLKRSRRLPSSSDSDTSSSDASDPAPGVHQPNPAFTMGSTFDASNFHEARDWLLPRFKSCHSGGHITCKNSRSDYVYASCLRCGDLSLKTNARAAVMFKGKKWSVTTCKNGAERPCQGPPVPPVQAPNEAVDQKPQPEVECMCCLDKVTAYITCDSNHVACLECWDRCIAIQCRDQFHTHFLKTRGVVCTTCQPAVMWRLGAEDIKKRCLCTLIFICILMTHSLASGCPKQVLKALNTHNVRHSLRTRCRLQGRPKFKKTMSPWHWTY